MGGNACTPLMVLLMLEHMCSGCTEKSTCLIVISISPTQTTRLSCTEGPSQRPLLHLKCNGRVYDDRIDDLRTSTPRSYSRDLVCRFHAVRRLLVFEIYLRLELS